MSGLLHGDFGAVDLILATLIVAAMVVGLIIVTRPPKPAIKVSPRALRRLNEQIDDTHRAAVAVFDLEDTR